MTRDALVAFCEEKKIVLEAWAPLVRGERFGHPKIVEMSKKYGKSPVRKTFFEFRGVPLSSQLEGTKR